MRYTSRGLIISSIYSCWRRRKPPYAQNCGVRPAAGSVDIKDVRTRHSSRLLHGEAVPNSLVTSFEGIFALDFFPAWNGQMRGMDVLLSVRCLDLDQTDIYFLNLDYLR